ncbi:hypothetical protein BaRGS_00032733, partial [Batillaria attramentaria]
IPGDGRASLEVGPCPGGPQMVGTHARRCDVLLHVLTLQGHCHIHALTPGVRILSTRPAVVTWAAAAAPPSAWRLKEHYVIIVWTDLRFLNAWSGVATEAPGEGQPELALPWRPRDGHAPAVTHAPQVQ